MAKKKAKVNMTAATEAKPNRKAGRPGRGPWWRPSRARWMATINDKQYVAPAEIGQADIMQARNWYVDLSRRHGIKVQPDSAEPTNSQKRTWTITPQALRELAAIKPLIATEHLMADTSDSHVVCVAIHEAHARRLGCRKKE